MAYYIDLFNGDPTGTGVSVLSAITGSSTRIDVTNDLTIYSYKSALVNPDVVAISSGSSSTVNVNYVGVYDASSGGNLLRSAPIGAFGSIASGNPVAFPALALFFSYTTQSAASSLSAVYDLIATISIVTYNLMLSEGGVQMVTEDSANMASES